MQRIKLIWLICPISVLVICLTAMHYSFAHPGTLDVSSGHHNRSTGEYHYHGVLAESSAQLNKENSRAAVNALPPTAQIVKPVPITNSVGEFSSEVPAPVLRVVDGDKIEVEYSGQSIVVRLIGVDTPKTIRSNTPFESSVLTSNLLLGESVYLRFDTKKKDESGRLLAYLYRASDGLFINLEIIRQGYGYTGTKYSFKHIELFRDYERKAREAGKGVWGNSVAAGFTGSQAVASNEGLSQRTYEVQQFQDEFQRQDEKIEFLIQQLEYVQELLAFQTKNNMALSERLKTLSQMIENLNQQNPLRKGTPMPSPESDSISEVALDHAPKIDTYLSMIRSSDWSVSR